MRMLRTVLALGIVMLLHNSGLTQGKTGSGTSSSASASAKTRYFELTLTLRYAGAAGQTSRSQSLTTDVAVEDGRSGSCRARVISQVPVTMEKGPTYLDVGTKFDCNNIHLDGNGLALSLLLETSAIHGMVKTQDAEGRTVEEPVVSQRNLSLQTKLLFDVPKVIFNTKDGVRGQPIPLKPGTDLRSDTTPVQDLTEVEMTARELRN